MVKNMYHIVSTEMYNVNAI